MLGAIKLRLLTQENVAPESIIGNEVGISLGILVYNTRIGDIILDI